MNVELRLRLDERRAQIEQALRSSLQLADGCPLSLREAMAYGLLAPGKRLRPLLAVLAAEAAGGEAKAALPAGCAVEMVHAYSLIHDDLPAMDDDDLRRGQPTVHKEFGDALAILAGDALLTLAFEVLASAYSGATAAACCRELARGAGAAGMVGGQVLDLTWDGKIAGQAQPATVGALEEVHASKTGALFLAALRLGLLVAQGGRPEAVAQTALDEFGRCFGLAFQITDDLLDVEGQAAVTGKRVGKDAARGKLTYPGLLGVEESRRRVAALAEQATAALRPLAPRSDPLAELMWAVVTRDQ